MKTQILILAIATSLLIFLSHRPSAVPPAPQWGSELWASRKVITDFQEAALRIHNEAANLEYDTRTLWQHWNQIIRPRGGFYSWIYGEDKSGVVRRSWEERRRSEIFNLHSHALHLEQFVRVTHGKIHVTEVLWEKLREKTAENANQDPLKIEFEEMKIELASLADELTKGDEETALLQERYDALRPLVLGHLNQVSQTTVYIRPAWHYSYSLSDTPRSRFYYSFEKKYQSYREQGRKQLGIRPI